jgi:hypothetical protein
MYWSQIFDLKNNGYISKSEIEFFKPTIINYKNYLDTQWS